MSSHIQYEAAAFRISKASIPPTNGRHPCFGHDIIVLLALGGDSNVYDHRNRRARDWYVMAIGEPYRVMQRVIDVSSDCEGGMLRWQNRDTLPESYIKRYRTLVDNAPLVNLPGRIPHFHLATEIHIHRKEFEAFDTYKTEQLNALRTLIPPQAKPYRWAEDHNPDNWISFPFDLTIPADLSAYLTYRHLSSRKDNANIKVTGPVEHAALLL